MGIIGYFIVIALLAGLLIKMIFHVLRYDKFDKAVHRPRDTGDSGIMEEVIRDEGEE